ncbi:hypothetical protein ACIQUF_04935 [Pseudomonas sp. NPDC090233]|uniref:hypothetical protein n=1 Tax=Pseudomonas sp. NPDC090233 TaxID=3364479 RepID=UPI00383B5116
MSNKIEAGRTSMVKLLALMHDVINNPALYRENMALVSALGSQVALACYADDERGITAFSLNTFKKHAIGLGETFQGIDSIRKAALKAIQKNKACRRQPSSRRSQSETIALLRKQRAAQDIDLMRLVMIVKELKDLAQRLAELDLPDRSGYYKKEISRINLMLITRGR